MTKKKTKQAEDDGKNPVGRPLKFKTVEDLQTAIELYFLECDKEWDTRKFAHEAIVQGEDGKPTCMNCGLPSYRRGCLIVEGSKKLRTPYTITGLAMALGTSRETLCDYEEKDGFSDTIKMAKLRVQNYLEIYGLFGDMAPAKAIFGLSNYGWKNPQHMKVSGDPDDPTPIETSLTVTFKKP